jgi:hypothetical protein
MFTTKDNKGKLFSLLSSDKYNKVHLLLPRSTSDPESVKGQDDEKTINTSEEIQSKDISFPPATGYIKYPEYDFF